MWRSSAGLFGIGSMISLVMRIQMAEEIQIGGIFPPDFTRALSEKEDIFLLVSEVRNG